PHHTHTLKHCYPLLCQYHARLRKRTSMLGARLQFSFEQSAVKLERPLPLLERGIERRAKSARPHLHRTTSAFSCFLCVLCAFSAFSAVKGFCLSPRLNARDREGRPRMRINPAASF